MFKVIDSDADGVVTESEFRDLLKMMNVFDREEEIEYMLQIGDPFNNQRMTYSDLVSLLSTQMIPVDQYNPTVTIPVLEKFINLNQFNQGDHQYQSLSKNQMMLENVTHIDNTPQPHFI